MSDPDYAVSSSRRVFEGPVISLRSDQVVMPGGGTSQRDVVEHPGAVGVVALRDDGAVHLIRQFRHPVRGYLWELPAGLLDVEGEPALVTAQRELVEEAGLEAGTWHTLVDTRSSPGMTDEAVRVFLARDVREAADGRPPAEHEELDLTPAWVDLDEAVADVLAGRTTNALAAIGLLAARVARDEGWARLRPPDAPWEARPGR